MKKLLLIALLLPSLANAEITPNKGNEDARVRIVDYSALNVVKLSTFYGVSTHIQFAEDETIKDVAVGDDQAWNIVPRGNHMFVKPKTTEADTNVTVITNKRSYQFALVVQPRPIKDKKAWKDPNLIYSLAFHYPEEEAAKNEAIAKKLLAKSKVDDVKTKLNDATLRSENTDYWVAGSDQISPTAARDDGTFIYLTFGKNRDIPAIFEVDEKGNEALIATSAMQGSTVVIQRLYPKLVLRKGDLVASVINKAYDIDGGKTNKTGTISNEVVREIKEAK